MSTLSYETTIKYVRNRPETEQVVTSPRETYDIFKDYFEDFIDHHEAMYAAFFDQANQLICITNLGKGSLSATVADFRTLYQTAILSNCKSVVLCHNHPSGSTKPSSADIQLTKRVKSGLDLFDMVLLDHLIITHDDYRSLANDGLV